MSWEKNSKKKPMIENNFCFLQGVPKKIGLLSSFEFLSLGGVFLGVKSNSKNSGTKTRPKA